VSYGDAAVVARAAGDHDDATGAADRGDVLHQATQDNLVVVEIDAATHRVDDRLGLLKDLFLHVMLERAYRGGETNNLGNYYFLIFMVPFMISAISIAMDWTARTPGTVLPLPLWKICIPAHYKKN